VPGKCVCKTRQQYKVVEQYALLPIVLQLVATALIPADKQMAATTVFENDSAMITCVVMCGVW
jgi:hypothetical protein